MKGISRKELILYVDLIDSKLNGYTEKLHIYCVGGTALTLLGKKQFSYDVDFLVSRRDYLTLSSITAEIEFKRNVRIDLMVEEDTNKFLHPAFKTSAKKIGVFKYLNLYVPKKVDLLLMKALCGRPKDYDDIKQLAKDVDKEAVVRRFNELRIKRGSKEDFAKKLNDIVEGIAEQTELSKDKDGLRKTLPNTTSD